MKREYQIVSFDWDSMIVNDEGLNWLANKKGKGAEVEELTRQSMNGEIPVEQVMPIKMKIISPSREDMQLLAEHYLANVSPDALEVMQELRRANIQIAITTGNFHEAVDPVAQALGIALEHIHANNLEFNSDGSYKSFVEHDHLMHDDGKQIVVAKLKERFRRVIHVGDSIGDISAKANVSIGYGGAVIRPAVLRNADIFIPGESVAPVLAVALSRRQLRNIPDAELRRKAESGLLVRRNVQR